MRRKWFQIHLSTAVILMTVAGALLGANMYPRYVIKLQDKVVQAEFGFIEHILVKRADRDGTLKIVRWHPVYENALHAVVVLLATAVCCEHFIRRRYRRAQQTQRDLDAG